MRFVAIKKGIRRSVDPNINRASKNKAKDTNYRVAEKVARKRIQRATTLVAFFMLTFFGIQPLVNLSHSFAVPLAKFKSVAQWPTSKIKSTGIEDLRKVFKSIFFAKLMAL